MPFNLREFVRGTRGGVVGKMWLLSFSSRAGDGLVMPSPSSMRPDPVRKTSPVGGCGEKEGGGRNMRV